MKIMSRFNNYAQKLNDTAKKNFEAYQLSERLYEEAQAKVRKYPKIIPVRDMKYEAERLTAEQELKDARTSMTRAQRVFNDSVRAFDHIRGELTDAISEAYATDPTMINEEDVKLMQSGIMTAEEYSGMMKRAADNPTMQRVIAKAAAEASKTTKDEREAVRLQTLAREVDTGSEYTDMFDSLVGVYKRCVKNPALIKEWDNLCGDAIEEF